MTSLEAVLLLHLQVGPGFLGEEKLPKSLMKTNPKSVTPPTLRTYIPTPGAPSRAMTLSHVSLYGLLQIASL